ncbi:hypothetical protein [Brevundimonas sp. NIBR11]|uniref:hypothetical protein n=1 Tax=Brevundimonas sp. NIBR11 TaxID=3015999 RepID=UPI0022EFF00D|nr:hypothetical protein [Brevundimonas sp. NIBR11]WGM31453.1 hypothetical protein KKHFBJBL_01700 [Brevundimonas sp. NIBR11]
MTHQTVTVPVDDVFVSACCKGERCICGRPAIRKIGEEIMPDDPAPIRHNLTAYVCAEHFALLLGPAAARSVGLSASPPATAAPGGVASVIVPLNRAPYPRAFLDAINGFATGGSGRCREAIEAEGAILAALPQETKGWRDSLEAVADDLRAISCEVQNAGHGHWSRPLYSDALTLERLLAALPSPPVVSEEG